MPFDSPPANDPVGPADDATRHFLGFRTAGDRSELERSLLLCAPHLMRAANRLVRGASFSAQVLARRKEFGLLVHLGLTRQQILRVVALEGAAWTTLGALAGVALGLAVAVVLVHVVNPQSFHWTMELALPWGRLSALATAVVVAGTTTAWLSGQAAAGRDAVMAVKEDW